MNRTKKELQFRVDNTNHTTIRTSNVCKTVMTIDADMLIRTYKNKQEKRTMSGI